MKKTQPEMECTNDVIHLAKKRVFIAQHPAQHVMLQSSDSLVSSTCFQFWIVFM